MTLEGKTLTFLFLLSSFSRLVGIRHGPLNPVPDTEQDVKLLQHANDPL